MNKRPLYMRVIIVIVLVIVAGFSIQQFFMLRKAHSTFENYYNFRGCVQLIATTTDSGTCRTSSGQTIKIVEINNKWYLEGDGPGIW
ncbi:MAG: hypothetical protein KGI49_00235 [Patescibacteria group bacterium]|nr:hypothetical protein [Patescibacteria group bacterium]